MKNTTLAFKSINDLWAFKRSVAISNVDVNVAAKSLSGEFSPADIEIAKNQFNAMEVETTTFTTFNASTNDDNNN